jgi:hypothetical protein
MGTISKLIFCTVSFGQPFIVWILINLDSNANKEALFFDCILHLR